MTDAGNEQLVAQGSAFVQMVTQLTQLGGPILGGLLIAWIGAPKVLLIDAATYVFSFFVIFVFFDFLIQAENSLVVLLDHLQELT